MKMTRHLTALAIALAITSCGTTTSRHPKAIPVYKPGSIEEIIDGLKNARRLIEEGTGLKQDIQRFRPY